MPQTCLKRSLRRYILDCHCIWATSTMQLERREVLLQGGAGKALQPCGADSSELATAIGGPEATSNELSILSAALNNLFEGSVRLDDAALAHLPCVLLPPTNPTTTDDAPPLVDSSRRCLADALPPPADALQSLPDTTLKPSCPYPRLSPHPFDSANV